MLNNSSIESPCGLYCGVCGIYQATQADDEKLLKIYLKIYRSLLPLHKTLTFQDLKCNGCRSDKISILCKSCSIRDCTADKNISGCHNCSEFPCTTVKEFPIPNGKKVIFRSVPYRRRHGTKAWIDSELSRYTCPKCKGMLSHGTTRCRSCKTQVSGD